MAGPLPPRPLVGVPQMLALLGWVLDRFEEGPYRGELYCRPARPGDRAVYPEAAPSPDPDPDPDPDPGRPFTPAAQQRARELLESLLEPAQLTEYRRSGTFWVDTTRGSVRLGGGDPVHVSPMGLVRSLCVVPTDSDELPTADSLATLLLWLRNDADHFFAVAVHLESHAAIPPAALGAPVPVAEEAAGAATADPTVRTAWTAELDRMAERVRGGPAPLRLHTGFTDLDAALSAVGPGDVVGISGPPGSGRSAFLLDVVRNCVGAARTRPDTIEPGRTGPVVHLCSPTGAAPTVVRELAANHAGIHRDHLIDPLWLTDAEWARLSGAVASFTETTLALTTGPGCAGWLREAAPRPAGDTAVFAVVDDCDALPGEAREVVADLRAAAARDATAVVVVLPAGADVAPPSRVAALVDVVIEVGPGHGACSQRRSLSITRNRRGPLARAEALLVGEWGRMVPVTITSPR